VAKVRAAVAIFIAVLAGLAVPGEPVSAQADDSPYAGSVYVVPDVITSDDPSSYVGSTDAGRGDRVVFDRRTGRWSTMYGYLFELSFSDGLITTAVVNPEFGSVEAAREQAEKYGWFVGQLPTGLRVDVDELWIHRGNQPWGGRYNSILIHTETNFETIGVIEEILVHEAAHTSLDSRLIGSTEWLNAQSLDARFITTYAADHPEREDVAESYLMYLAVRYKRARIDDAMYATIAATMPNRIAAFDALGLEMGPVEGVIGDSNCDDEMGAADAQAALHYLVGNRVDVAACPLGNPLGEVNGAVVDLDLSGDVSVADALLIARCLAGIEGLGCAVG